MNRRSAFRWVLALAGLFALALPARFLAAQSAPGRTGETQFPLASRLGLTPPPGMTLSKSFQGFEDSKNNVFMRLVAMPDDAYAEIEKAMTNQALKKQSITVERRESFALPASKGLLIVARQETDKIKIRKWLLIAPVGDLTALVSLEIPLAAKGVYSDAAIRASFTTLAARSTIPAEEQLALVPFNLRDLAGFRVAGVVPGRAVQLTDGEKEAADSVEHANLVISIGPGGPSSSTDRDSFARLQFSGPPSVKDMRILSSEPMRIGGQPGHQMRAIGKDAKSGAEIEIVQWLRFGSGAYVRMVGFAPKDGWIPAFTRFRAVRDGLEPR
jgi:hypothetical protein